MDLFYCKPRFVRSKGLLSGIGTFFKDQPELVQKEKKENVKKGKRGKIMERN